MQVLRRSPNFLVQVLTMVWKFTQRGNVGEPVFENIGPNTHDTKAFAGKTSTCTYISHIVISAHS